nr:mucin-2-like [Procambarus clarkii]
MAAGYQRADAHELANVNPGHRQLKIEPRSCVGPQGQPGSCMFNFECYQLEGKVVGTCIDGFLFGACCQAPHDVIGVTTEPSAGGEVKVPGVGGEVKVPGVGGEVKVPGVGGGGMEGEAQHEEAGNNAQTEEEKVEEQQTMQNGQLEVQTAHDAAEDEGSVHVQEEVSNDLLETGVAAEVTSERITLTPSSGPTIPSVDPEVETSQIPEEQEAIGGHTEDETLPSTPATGEDDNMNSGATITPVDSSTDSSVGERETGIPVRGAGETQASWDIDTSTVERTSDGSTEPSTMLVTTDGGHDSVTAPTSGAHASTAQSTEVTNVAAVKDQLESSVIMLDGEFTSTSHPFSVSSTESSSTYQAETETETFGSMETETSESLVETITIVRNVSPSFEGPNFDFVGANTEDVPVMTMPEGQEGFVTHQISISDVTDPSLEDDTVSERPDKLPTLDMTHFEAEPTTSFRPYLTPTTRPTTRPTTDSTDTSTTNEILLFWSTRPPPTKLWQPNSVQPQPTPPPVDIAAETNFNFSVMTTVENEVLTTDTPRSTFAPRPAMLRPKPDEQQTAPETPASTTIESTDTIGESKGTTKMTERTHVSSRPMATQSKITTESLLFWTLSPHPSILDARPPVSVMAQVTSMSTKVNSPDTTVTPWEGGAETDDPLLFWTVSPQPAIMNIRPHTTASTTITTSEPDFADPLAFWTTTRPLKPRPTTRPDVDLPLLIWTTTKRPQASVVESSTEQSTVFTTIHDDDMYMEPAIIPGDVLQHITGDLLQRRTTTTTTSPTSKPLVPWPASIIEDVHDNTISASTATKRPRPTTTTRRTTPSTTRRTTTTTRPTTTTTRPTTTTTRPTTTTTRPTTTTTRPTTTTTRPTTTKTTTQRPTATIQPTTSPIPKPTTEEPISPIDQFIADFINSSPSEEPSSTTQSSPPIDLDLLSQVSTTKHNLKATLQQRRVSTRIQPHNLLLRTYLLLR